MIQLVPNNSRWRLVKWKILAEDDESHAHMKSRSLPIYFTREALGEGHRRTTFNLSPKGKCSSVRTWGKTLQQRSTSLHQPNTSCNNSFTLCVGDSYPFLPTACGNLGDTQKILPRNAIHLRNGLGFHNQSYLSVCSWWSDMCTEIC